MTKFAIDTLDLANKLKEAGTGNRQAEAIAGAIANGLSRSGGELATKADLTVELAKLETRMTTRIDEFVLAVALGQAGLILVGVFAMTRFVL